jgi:hypothetical protein
MGCKKHAVYARNLEIAELTSFAESDTISGIPAVKRDTWALHQIQRALGRRR